MSTEAIEAVAETVASRALAELQGWEGTHGRATDWSTLVEVSMSGHDDYERLIGGEDCSELLAAVFRRLEPVGATHHYECVVVWSKAGRDRFDHKTARDRTPR